MRIADLDAILAADLSAVEKMVLVAIASHINEADQTVWPSIERIAQLGGMHPTTAVRAIQRLRKLGIVQAKRRFSQSTVYQLSLSAITGGAPVMAQLHPSYGAPPLSVMAESESNRPINHPEEPSKEEPRPAPHLTLSTWVNMHSKDAERREQNRATMAGLVSAYGIKEVQAAAEIAAHAAGQKVWPDSLLPILIARAKDRQPVAEPVKDTIRLRPRSVP